MILQSNAHGRLATGSNSQRKFRERRDGQLKALEAEIADLKEQIDGYRCQILDLQDALTEATTQVDTL
jgi:chromosome segregation ATPase